MTTPHRPRSLALGGFMGVGKTTVGRALASRLGLPFVDTDVLLVQAHGPIAEQFAEDGEAVFRERERLVVRELSGGEPRVIATGGGLWADPRNRSALRDFARLVVLHAPIEVIRARIHGDGARPLATDLEARLAARASAYADADFSLDTGAAPVDGVVEAIVAWWRA